MKKRFDNFGTPICVNFAGLQCVPLNECTNVYGTKADHFARLGVVSPIQTNCLADSGTLYCITVLFLVTITIVYLCSVQS